MSDKIDNINSKYISLILMILSVPTIANIANIVFTYGTMLGTLIRTSLTNNT